MGLHCSIRCHDCGASGPEHETPGAATFAVRELAWRRVHYSEAGERKRGWFCPRCFAARFKHCPRCDQPAGADGLCLLHSTDVALGLAVRARAAGGAR
jgi:hypothetical protein